MKLRKRVEMKKNILILGCKNYPAFSSKKVISGGMEVYVLEILRHLKDTYNFTIISGYSQRDDKVKVISVPLVGGFALQPISLCLYSFIIALWIALFGKKIDLINAQTPLSGLIGFFLKKLLKIPYIVSVHIFASDEDHVGKYARIYGAIEKIVLKNADKVVAAGNQLKHFLDQRYAFSDGHVVVINPGMDLCDVDPGLVSDEIVRQVEGDFFKILFMGRLVKENGLLDLLEAVKILGDRPIKLLIAGNGNLEGVVREFINKEGLQEKVKMLGIVKGADKLYLIKHVNLSIRTSYHEVFPVAYLESIAFGIPVIATPVGDTEILAQKTGAITIVPIKQPEATAEAIKKQIQAGPLSQEIIDRCRLFIKSINWQRQARFTQDLFDTIMKEKK